MRIVNETKTESTATAEDTENKEPRPRKIWQIVCGWLTALGIAVLTVGVCAGVGIAIVHFCGKGPYDPPSTRMVIGHIENPDLEIKEFTKNHPDLDVEWSAEGNGGHGWYNVYLRAPDDGEFIPVGNPFWERE